MTVVQNGVATLFSEKATSNYFMFTMNKSGTILLSGSDKYNSDINTVKLYDTDLNLVKSWTYVQSGTTAKLDAGTYIIQPVDDYNGTFAIYSNNMSDSVSILQDDDGDGKLDTWNDGYSQSDSTTGLILDTMVNEDAGNLIILTGDSDNPTDPLYIASQKLSATYYNRFNQRGLSGNDIYWLNFNDKVDVNYDGVNDDVVDNSYFSKDDFYNSITSWAVKENKKGPLYIYMVDHGANGAFGNVSFSKFLADEILSGENLQNSYSNAVTKLKNLGGVYTTQVPVIYNGSDHMKNIMVGGDFSVANINLTSITNVYIDGLENNTNVDLKSKKYINLKIKLFTTSKINKVWATVITPDFTVKDGNFTAPDLTNYTQTLTFNNANEYAGLFYPPSSTMYSGKYDITFYVEDTDGLIYTQSQIINVNGEQEYNSNESNNTNPQIAKTLTVIKGWNLISLPVDTNISYNDLSTKLPNASTIWKYKDGWKAYGKGSIQTLLNNASIAKIETISKAQGFWVNASSSDTLIVSGNSYNIANQSDLSSASTGWHLLGTGTATSVSSIVTANSNISTIWTYSDGGWNAYSPNKNTQILLDNAKIPKLSDVNKAQGFWVNIK